MYSNDRSVENLILDITDKIGEIDDFMTNVDKSALLKDEKLQAAITRNLQIVTEAMKYMPYHLQRQYPDVPWRQIVSMRNYLTHEYFRVPASIIWNTYKKDLPIIRSFLSNISNRDMDIEQ